MHHIQEKILEKISDIDVWDITLRGIGELVGEKSAQKVKHHLTQLEKNGLIKIYRKDQRIKNIKKIESGQLDESAHLIAIPIFGYADCGNPTAIAEQRPEGFIKISETLLKKTQNIFALKAVGNSMNRAKISPKGNNIEEGDFVIVDYENRQPENGDYILSIIDGCANLKKFVFDKENNQIVLVSESSQNYNPIFIHPDDEYLVGGKIIQVIKNPKF